MAGQEIDGIVYLGINGNLYDINDVDQVIDKEYYEKWNNSGNTTGSSKLIQTIRQSKEIL